MTWKAYLKNYRRHQFLSWICKLVDSKMCMGVETRASWTAWCVRGSWQGVWMLVAGTQEVRSPVSSKVSTLQYKPCHYLWLASQSRGFLLLARLCNKWMQTNMCRPNELKITVKKSWKHRTYVEIVAW